MVTMPLFALLVFGAIVAIKWGPLSLGPVILGLFIGLTMASTTMGPPVLNALTEATAQVTSAISHSTGGQR